jgi:hypothetical protein
VDCFACAEEGAIENGERQGNSAATPSELGTSFRSLYAVHEHVVTKLRGDHQSSAEGVVGAVRQIRFTRRQPIRAMPLCVRRSLQHFSLTVTHLQKACFTGFALSSVVTQISDVSAPFEVKDKFVTRTVVGTYIGWKSQAAKLPGFRSRFLRHRIPVL